MGRWAQSRRRGAPGRAAGPLGPPPAPIVSVFEDNIRQESMGAGNAGGQIKLYYSPSGEPPGSLADTAEWEFVHDWAPAGAYENMYVWGTEVGNGTDYVGESARSVPLLIP